MAKAMNKKSYLPVGIAIAALAAVYLLGPIDIIPDFLAGVGQIDDVIVLILSAIAEMKLLADSNKATVTADEAEPQSEAEFTNSGFGAYKEI